MSTFKIDSDEHFVVVGGISYNRVIPSLELLKQPLSDRKRWADALRSGEYKQWGGLLYDEATKGYCCLGVWEAINGVPIEVLKECAMPSNLDLSRGRGNNRHRLGEIFPEDIRLPIIGHLHTCFTELNDAGKATFNQIAALIHPEGVTDWKALQ